MENNSNQRFGLVPMTFNQELRVSNNVKTIRNAKVTGNLKLSTIISLCQSEMERLKNAPEIDETHQAALMTQYVEQINQAFKIVSEICCIGHNPD